MSPETRARVSDEEPSGFIARHAQRVVPPLFLSAMLVLGGASTEAVIATGVLQLLAILVLLWCLFDGRMQKLSTSGWWLVGLLLALILVIALQLAPLPPDIWSRLPGRQEVVEAFVTVGGPLPWMPVSLAPEETVFGALKFLPPLAAFVLVARTPLQSMVLVLPWVLVSVAAASVMVGVGQVLGGRESPLYIYAYTNWGQPVGFMANANHQAAFLLMTLPFAAVLAGRLLVRSETGDGDASQGLMLAALAITLVLGVAIAGSAAGYALGIPAVLLSILAARARSGWSILALLLGAVVSVSLIGLFAFSSPVLSGLGMTDFSSSPLGRPDTYARTIEAIKEVMPIGSGLGSFKAFFPRFEDPALVTSTFMNHAHNDYLEFVLEFGVFGVGFIAVMLIWLIQRSLFIWRQSGSEGDRIRKAASIALLIVVLHSLVDYPLRTTALAGFASMCLGLMVARAGASRPRPDEEKDVPLAQHVVI